MIMSKMVHMNMCPVLKVYEILQGILEDNPLATQAGMYSQHDGALSRVSYVVIQHLNNTSPGRMIGHGCPINCWTERCYGSGRAC
jgi:hypothetical protein